MGKCSAQAEKGKYVAGHGERKQRAEKENTGKRHPGTGEVAEAILRPLSPMALLSSSSSQYWTSIIECDRWIDVKAFQGLGLCMA